MRRRGEILSLWTFMEVLIGTLAVMTVGYLMLGMIDGNTFFQSFYAKDNAHIIEALHGVPNGNMHLAYLWSSREYEISIARGTTGEVYIPGTATHVDVSKIIDHSKSAEKMLPQFRTKYFGSSAETLVSPTGYFAPQFYQYISKRGSITVQRHFNQLSCVDATEPLGAIAVEHTTSFSDEQEEAVDRFARDLQQQFTLQQQQAQGTPLQIHLNVQYSPIERQAVYYNGLSNRVQRTACLVAQELSTQQQNVEYGAAPRIYQQGELIIVIETNDVNTLRRVVEGVAAGLSKYGEVSG